MSDTAMYRVIPDEYQGPVMHDQEKPHAMQGAGWIIPLAFLGVGILVAIVARSLILPSQLESFAEAHGILILFVDILGGTAVSCFVLTVRYWSKLHTLQKAKDARERAELVRTAEMLTSHLNAILTSSHDIASGLPQLQQSASAALDRADREYADNAFAPFWDAVETAAKNIAAFEKGIRELSQNATEYYRLLKDHRHTFPKFPVRVESVPSNTIVLEKFNRVVRMGQQNFHFANIYEHRRTREILIGGFRTLADAVNNLGAVLEESISALHASLASGFARVVDEAISIRDTIDLQTLEERERDKQLLRALERR